MRLIRTYVKIAGVSFCRVQELITALGAAKMPADTLYCRAPVRIVRAKNFILTGLQEAECIRRAYGK